MAPDPRTGGYTPKQWPESSTLYAPATCKSVAPMVDMHRRLTMWMALGVVLLGSSVGIALGLWLVRVIAP